MKTGSLFTCCWTWNALLLSRLPPPRSPCVASWCHRHTTMNSMLVKIACCLHIHLDVLPAGCTITTMKIGQMPIDISCNGLGGERNDVAARGTLLKLQALFEGNHGNVVPPHSRQGLWTWEQGNYCFMLTSAAKWMNSGNRREINSRMERHKEWCFSYLVSVLPVCFMGHCVWGGPRYSKTYRNPHSNKTDHNVHGILLRVQL